MTTPEFFDERNAQQWKQDRWFWGVVFVLFSGIVFAGCWKLGELVFETRHLVRWTMEDRG